MFGIPAKISSVSVLPSVPLAKTNSDTNLPKEGGGGVAVVGRGDVCEADLG